MTKYIVLLCWRTLKKFWKRCEFKKSHLYIDDEIEPIEIFVESESVTDFNGF